MRDVFEFLFLGLVSSATSWGSDDIIEGSDDGVRLPIVMVGSHPHQSRCCGRHRLSQPAMKNWGEELMLPEQGRASLAEHRRSPYHGRGNPSKAMHGERCSCMCPTMEEQGAVEREQREKMERRERGERRYLTCGPCRHMASTSANHPLEPPDGQLWTFLRVQWLQNSWS
jgi:hypothetical protein